jgi:hypothetical protein
MSIAITVQRVHIELWRVQTWTKLRLSQDLTLQQTPGAYALRPARKPPAPRRKPVSADQFEDVVLLRDDGLASEEREELLQAIDESLAEAEVGNVEDFSKLINAMRQQP